ncbi:hypothetical protein FA13DRAFT_941477 [Coprinellus micaceus]|uniref:Uncharacterized protein n=1 Tax=Coprinellus micaceus TaxID=71717 RepID=A0A4Y7RYK5_COPMI|nr:hypothetical protein FA13DRAFT_941477 [Coprinellus micaceus]
MIVVVHLLCDSAWISGSGRQLGAWRGSTHRSTAMSAHLPGRAWPGCHSAGRGRWRGRRWGRWTGDGGWGCGGCGAVRATDRACAGRGACFMTGREDGRCGKREGFSWKVAVFKEGRLAISQKREIHRQPRAFVLPYLDSVAIEIRRRRRRQGRD